MEQPQTPPVEKLAAMLKSAWQERSESPSRDFYVASHPGWNRPTQWSHQAEIDASTILMGLDAETMKQWQVLEIGCGVGRLALPISRQVQGYTGVDIAPGMIEEARRRTQDISNTRFHVSNGAKVAEEACDRQYDLVFAISVFIHCPKAVIAGLIEDAYRLLTPGGQFRFNVLGDHEDPTGIEAAPEVEAQTHEQIKAVEDVITDEQRELLVDRYYMGDAFRYDELEPFLLPRVGPEAQLTLHRWDLANIYGIVEKPALDPKP